HILKGYQWDQNTIGCSKSLVYRLVSMNKDTPTYYLKIHKPEIGICLLNEYKILNWLGNKLLVPEVIYFDEFEDQEYLLITEVEGEVSYLAPTEEEKKRNIAILAQGLKKIHSISIEGCPVDNSLEKLLQIVEKRLQAGLVDRREFDRRWKNYSSETLFQQLLDTKIGELDLVFTHGDYCLPNILIKDGKLSGFVDLMFVGIGDRYWDFAAVVWSICFNFGEKYMDLFFDKYGLKEVDWERIRFYQILNEFL
ncbi:MAG: APH(3') family aminoglycoside O-phosphotransferase, partial [Candidatus Heimdallarchaeaceae archaeon]